MLRSYRGDNYCDAGGGFVVDLQIAMSVGDQMHRSKCVGNLQTLPWTKVRRTVCRVGRFDCLADCDLNCGYAR